MEETYPEDIKYFPSNKFTDKSPLATLVLKNQQWNYFKFPNI